MELVNLRFWTNFPYQEGAIEIPSRSTALPNPDLTYSKTLHVDKNRWMTTLNLEVNYLNMQTVRYLAFTYLDSSGATQEFYGWVDGVTIGAASTDPLTYVHWHPDLWMMWRNNVKLGSGIITRRTADLDIPPQPYPYRYKITSSNDFDVTIPTGNPDIITRGRIFWIYFTIVKTGSNRRCCFPVSVDDLGFYIDVSGEELKCANWANIVLSSWDEELGLDPQSITAAFICPYPPSNVSGNSRKLTLEGWHGIKIGTKNTPVFTPTNETTAFKESIVTLSSPVSTDDVDEYNIVGWDNEVIGTVPWGLEINKVGWRVILGSTSAYVQVRGIPTDMNPDIPLAQQTEYSQQMGVCWTIPMVTLDVSENAQSSYVYSGAREVDLQQRKNQAVMGLAQGLASAATGGATVSGISAITTNVPGRERLPNMSGWSDEAREFQIDSARYNNHLRSQAIGKIGALGVATAGLSAVGAGVSYGINRYMDGMIQDTLDYAHAHQTNGLIMSGSGFDTCIFGPDITFRRVEIDNYSLMQRNADIWQYGAHVYEPKLDCDAWLDKKGPLQIQNLVVTGYAPTEAVNYIKERLARGVRLV